MPQARGYKKRLLHRYDDSRGGLTDDLKSYLEKLRQIGFDSGSLGIVATELIATTADRQEFEAELSATSPESRERARERSRVRKLLNEFDAFLDADRSSTAPCRPFFDRRDPKFVDRVHSELDAYRNYFMLDRDSTPTPQTPPHRPGESWLKKHVPHLVSVFSLHRNTHRRAIVWTQEGLVAAGHNITVATVRAVAKATRREARGAIR